MGCSGSKVQNSEPKLSEKETMLLSWGDLIDDAQYLNLMRMDSAFIVQLNTLRTSTPVFFNTFFPNLLKEVESEEGRSRLRYLQRLFSKGLDAPETQVALTFLIRFGRVFELSDEVIKFFIELKKIPVAEERIFNLIAEKIRLGLFFNEGHLNDIVVGIRHLQAVSELTGDLTEWDGSLATLIENFKRVTGEKLKELAVRTRTAQMRSFSPGLPAGKLLMHHGRAHAEEMVVRSSLCLEKLSSEGSFFQQELAKLGLEFMVRFHDFIQDAAYRPDGRKGTNEEVTADFIMRWLDEEVVPVDINNRETLMTYFGLLAHFTIVLGTTLVWGKGSIKDLSECCFEWIDVLLFYPELNLGAVQKPWVVDTMNMVVMTGICDKAPVTIAPVANAQARDGLACTGILVCEALGRADLAVFEFTGDDAFVPYVPKVVGEEEDVIALNRQSFLLALAANFAMRTELARNRGGAQNLVKFVEACRTTRGLSPKRFKELMEACDIYRLTEEIFFSSVEHEIDFALSLDNIASLAYLRLKQQIADEKFAELFNLEDPLISRARINAHASNLRLFAEFYQKADLPVKQALVQELVLTLVYQAGEVYVRRVDFEHGSIGLLEDRKPLEFPVKPEAIGLGLPGFVGGAAAASSAASDTPSPGLTPTRSFRCAE